VNIHTLFAQEFVYVPTAFPHFSSACLIFLLLGINSKAPVFQFFKTD